MTLLDPAQYRRVPWKNGGGESVEIAAERSGEDGWGGLVWSYSRTRVLGPSAFSDLTGIERLICVVEGVGVSLVPRDGATPTLHGARFSPIRFDGGLAVDGVPDEAAVGVVNLMGARGKVRIALEILREGQHAALGEGITIIHACAGSATVHEDGATRELAPDAALRLTVPGEVAVVAGVVACARITPEGEAGR